MGVKRRLLNSFSSLGIMRNIDCFSKVTGGLVKVSSLIDIDALV